MKCSECQSFRRIGNTDETRQGLCAHSTSYFPVDMDKECVLFPAYEPKCKNCGRFAWDTACMTCDEEDSAIHSGHLCSGFIDMDEEKIVNILVQWRARGIDIQEKLNECMKQANDVKLPEHI